MRLRLLIPLIILAALVAVWLAWLRVPARVDVVKRSDDARGAILEQSDSPTVHGNSAAHGEHEPAAAAVATVPTLAGPMHVQMGVAMQDQGLRLFNALVARGSTIWVCHAGEPSQFLVTADADVAITEIRLPEGFPGALVRPSSPDAAWKIVLRPQKAGVLPVAVRVAGASAWFTIQIKVIT